MLDKEKKILSHKRIILDKEKQILSHKRIILNKEKQILFLKDLIIFPCKRVNCSSTTWFALFYSTDSYQS